MVRWLIEVVRAIGLVVVAYLLSVLVERAIETAEVWAGTVPVQPASETQE